MGGWLSRHERPDAGSGLTTGFQADRHRLALSRSTGPECAIFSPLIDASLRPFAATAAACDGCVPSILL
ncbi:MULTISPECIES: hypothetical protein [Brucella]|uniref:hypothetical protein n=1 Tax=Brucella TaxID=234 RepID=UPI0009E1D506|nr:hypothetical protein [Brucella inopinata]